MPRRAEPALNTMQAILKAYSWFAVAPFSALTVDPVTELVREAVGGLTCVCGSITRVCASERKDGQNGRTHDSDAVLTF